MPGIFRRPSRISYVRRPRWIPGKSGPISYNLVAATGTYIQIGNPSSFVYRYPYYETVRLGSKIYISDTLLQGTSAIDATINTDSNINKIRRRQSSL